MKKMYAVFTIVLSVTLVSFCLFGCSKKKTEIPSAEMQTQTMATQLNAESFTPQAATKAESEAQSVVAESKQIEQKAATTTETTVQSAKPTGEEIQTALKNAGYYTGSIDGKLGPKSKKAIEAFQKDSGLKADGKVGAKTWSKLQVHLNANPAQKTGD